MANHLARSTFLSLVVALLAGGCGASPSTIADTGPDPLIGTWFAQITTGADNQTETVTFTGSGAFTAVHSQVNDPTSSVRAGCTEVVTEVGTWTTTLGLITLYGTAGASTVTTSGCTSAADDMSGPFTGTAIFPATGSPVAYSVTGSELTLAGTVFTRR